MVHRPRAPGARSLSLRAVREIGDNGWEADSATPSATVFDPAFARAREPEPDAAPIVTGAPVAGSAANVVRLANGRTGLEAPDAVRGVPRKRPSWHPSLT